MDREELAGWIVKPDGWSVGTGLNVCDDWDKADYRLNSFHTNLDLAVNVRITGRTYRPSPIGYALRCEIVFVGDGEPDVIVHGWARAPKYN